MYAESEQWIGKVVDRQRYRLQEIIRGDKKATFKFIKILRNNGGGDLSQVAGFLSQWKPLEIVVLR